MDSEVSFLLDPAPWPALVVEPTGMIPLFNPAAARTFGSLLQGVQAALNTLWAAGNALTAEEFLHQAAKAPGAPIPLRLRLNENATGGFLACVSRAGTPDPEFFILQLFAENTAGPFASKADSSPEAAALDANLAHKQKLDCALQLARTVALDFNNALTSVLGHASLLLSKAESGHPWRGSLVEIEKSASKAAEIAHDLATFSLQEKQNTAQPPGNLNLVLQRSVDLFRTPDLARITWTLHFERKLLAAKFDEAKLQQALVKVLENSVQAIADTGSINVQTRNLTLDQPVQDRTAKLNPGNYVCIEISDSGAGIPQDILPRVFEPFFSTKKGHRGLGLAWVYGIVTNHGGSVAVSAEVDVGASVRIYLPAQKTTVRDSSIPSGDLSGHQTILIVDDEDLLLTMGRMVLSSFGYEVLTANSGLRAVEILASGKKVDLVITDLVMPNMSGRELVEHIRRTTPHVRVICSSGFVRGKTETDDLYLQKPFTSQDLLRKVKQALATDA